LRIGIGEQATQQSVEGRPNVAAALPAAACPPDRARHLGENLMPIMRTYMCGECSHRMEVTLSAEQWDAPPPSCESCDARMGQEFKPPAIGGSVSLRAHRVAEDIIANDYNVANVQFDNRQGGTPKVRYKDQSASQLQSTWGGQIQGAIETAVAIGKQNRRENGGFDGLDMLKANLASGAQPDLIEASRRRAIKVW
jgi:hypothetical protein